MLSQSNAVLKIIQVTDTHLFKDDQLILGVNSHATFVDVIREIKEKEISDADAIFLTGDLSQDESEESYKIIAKELRKLPIPIFWIPGNHDSLEKMTRVFNDALFTQPKHLNSRHWNFIFLNTKKNGTDKGYLSDTEEKFLVNELKNADKSKSTAIVMHHHPVEVGTPMIDEYVLMNKDIFWEIVEGQVSLIICGHVHGNYSLNYKNINIEASPATCLQWKKGASQLSLENKIGYKTYYFESGKYVAKENIWDDQTTF